MNFHIRLAGSVYRHALTRAGGTPEALRRKVEEFVINYANGATIQQRGGRAVAEALTPEERSAKGRAAVTARWDAVRAAEKRETP